MSAPFLVVKNLRMFYRLGKKNVRAVDDVSFEVEKKGDSLAVVGESGCGKSSLALALLRLYPTNVHRIRGEVWLEGKDILRMSENEFRKTMRWKKISWVPQGVANSLNPVLRTGNQIKEVLHVHGVKNKEEETARLLKMVGLSEDAALQYPHQLSGGQKQRICIAMALALRPSLVILDEPTSALDVSLQGQIIQLLDDLKQKFEFSYIFITHDIALAASICESFAILYAGKIVEIGKREKVLSAPLHPYTQKLLECAPRLDRAGLVDFIPGEPPDLKSPPTGCRFHPRCPIADSEKCREIEPTLEKKQNKQHVACHYR